MTTSPPPSSSTPVSVAELEQSVEQLKVANYYLRVALDQVADGVVIVESEASDPQSGPKVLFSNAAAAMLAGADPETGLRGMGLNELAAEEQDAATLMQSLHQAAQNGGCHECECRLQSLRTQAPVDCKWRVRAVFNSLRKLLNYTVLISPAQTAAPVKTEIKAAADDLDAQSEQLRKENLAALAQGIAHDVNNLLGPATVRLSALIPQVQEHPALAQELQAVFTGLKRAKQFTSQVVTASKGAPRRQEPTDLAALMRDTVEFAGAGSNVRVCVRQDDDLRPALADPAKLSQVLQNLVMNGIQAMPHGGYMDVEAHNVMIGGNGDGVLKPGPHVRLVVRDRGCGITKANLDRLFHESFTTKADGNGIGLTTCKHSIDEMNGDIRVASTPNIGTEFSVFLPAAEGSGVTKPLNTPADAAPVPLKHGKGKVLIVDDEDDLRKVANMILTRCGYEVVQCDNGQDAVKIYQSLFRTGTPPDVVLMDLTLRGGMNGTETAAEILHLDPDARIVCTSGSVTQEVQMVFLERGFVGVLPKPYEAGELTQTVHRIATLMKRN